MGRPEGKSKASLVSTFRLDFITTGLVASIPRFGLGTTGIPALALRLALRTTALRVTDFRLVLRATPRVVCLVSLCAIVNSPLRSSWTCWGPPRMHLSKHPRNPGNGDLYRSWVGTRPHTTAGDYERRRSARRRIIQPLENVGANPYLPANRGPEDLWASLPFAARLRANTYRPA
jgi:hypothetical protein